MTCKPEEVTLTVTKQRMCMLHQLRNTGLYGTTCEEVMQNLITEGLRRAVCEGLVSTRTAPETRFRGVPLSEMSDKQRQEMYDYIDESNVALDEED